MLDELTSTLGNIEPSWSHNPTNDELRGISEILDKCTRAWWERTYAVEKIVETLWWSAANRSGYIFPVWNPHFHGTGQGDIELRTGGPKDYLPLWPDKSNDIQRAYAGTIIVKMPITEFAATWPTLAESVYPDGEQPKSLIPRVIRGAQELFDPSDEQKFYEGRVPTVTVYWTFVRDMSLNVSDRTIQMGDPGTSWSYKVPAFGSDIPTGLINLATANDLTRKATRDDTYLYPWLRLMIWTQDVICYDGPSYYFHGKIPAVKLTLKPRPWTFLGGSLVRDIAALAEARQRELRSIDKRGQLRGRPPRMVNMEVLDPTTAESLERLIETPNGMLKFDNFRDGDPMKSLVTWQDLQVDQWELEYLKFLPEEMRDILGLNNLQRLAEMRQMPSGDNSEKLLQMTGARTQRKGNIMEKFCAELAPMIDALIFQRYDMRFRWNLLGYKGIDKVDFDFDPGSLVPYDVPGAPKGLAQDRKWGDSLSGMFDSRAKRARYLYSAIGVQIEKGSLLDITSMTRQLIEMRLWGDPQFPKDPETLGASLRLTNVGKMDDDEEMDTRIGRGKKWARIYTETVAKLQSEAQRLMQGGTPESAITDGIKRLVDHATQGNGSGGAHVATGMPEGRRPVYSSPPILQEKSNPDGSTRTIINTSRGTNE